MTDLDDELRLLDDHQLAAELAARAGQLLLGLRHDLGVNHPDLRNEGDRQSNELLLRALATARPADAVLSEESADDPSRLQADRVWIIDPLDGTREFGEGRSDWAVHVALWQEGELVAGAVALPAEGEVLTTDPPAELAERPDGPVRLVVSRSRPPALATALGEALGAELVEMGSAGAKAMSVLRGETDIYAHGGGQYEWDSAAPVAVALAAGVHASRIDGSPLRYNQQSPWLPDLLVCRPELAERVLAAIASLDTGS